MNNKFFNRITGEIADKPVKAGSKSVARAAGESAAVASGNANSPAQRSKPPPTVKPLDIKVPDNIGRYQIGRRIGSGTCGVVHLARDKLLGRQVAVKLSPVGETQVSTGKVPGAQRAYQTELLAAGKLAHPNIVTVYDAGQFGELNYLVMEAIEGRSLKEFGKGKKLLPASEALRVITVCCRALDYSHAQGILHRDIKPANIMLSRDGGVKLLDFGIAVGLTDDGVLKKQGPTLGTPNYMSPEQVLGKELTAQSDFYSLATVLFELLTGRQLFKAKKVKDLFRLIVHRKAPDMRSLRPDLPSALAETVARALEKKPKDRYASGAQMASEIEPHMHALRSMQQQAMPQLRLIKRLQKQAFFANFSEPEIALLIARVSFRLYAPTEPMRMRQDQVRRLMIITDGVVKCTLNGGPVALYSAGDCIGEIGFLNNGAEMCEYQALTQVSILELSNDDLARLPPKVHLQYFRHVANILGQRKAHNNRQAIDVVL